MKKYVLTGDGAVVEGHDAHEIVQQMSRLKMTTPRSLRSYRRAVADRARQLHGVVVNTDTNDSFINSLLSHGMLRDISGKGDDE